MSELQREKVKRFLLLLKIKKKIKNLNKNKKEKKKVREEVEEDVVVTVNVISEKISMGKHVWRIFFVAFQTQIYVHHFLTN